MTRGVRKPDRVQPGPGLRERKKALTREAIADSAKRMFAERSYDQVTVAEIADAANIAVKTLFTYFASKEDILLAGEEEACAELARHVAERPEGSSPFDAMQSFMLISLYRLQTSGEIRSYIASFPPDRQRQARGHWIQASAAIIGSGIKDYGHKAARTLGACLRIGRPRDDGTGHGKTRHAR